jgi:uncharacterized phage protein gp47/JayE
MANNLPQPKSYEQLQSEMLQAYASKMGVNDTQVSSVITSFFEVVSLTTARSSGDIFQIISSYSVDRATGDSLKRLARENRVTPISSRPATGYVSVTDTTFNKISTKIYAGYTAPNVGTTQLRVSDASNFPSSGSVYIGRTTPNVEGPISYSSITPIGGYYILNLDSPTTKYHNVGETVILAQGGNRNVPVGTLVICPATGANPDIQFSTTMSAIILDGETEVGNIPVAALLPGSSGNIPRLSIKQFVSPPFVGASVTNTEPFTSGADSETDDELRVRIKRALESKGLGTSTAIIASVIGSVATDEQSTITSASIINDEDGATVFIDNSSGLYEAKTEGVGLERIVDSALGGEYFFQLATGGRQAPVAKAFLESTLESPFDLRGGDTLSLVVGETTYEHVFDDSDFKSPGGATAYEVSASINGNPTLGFECSTSAGGVKVVFRSKTESSDSLRITTPTTNGRDASILLGLPASEAQTLRLYKNDIPLSKDGKTASVFSQDQALWSSLISDGETLVISVDGTTYHTYTINDSDFIATGLYTTVSASNSLESWIQVLNSKITGITASIVGQQLKLTSNLETNNRAKISISPSSSLVSKGMFSSNLGLDAQGKQSDFKLSRNTAQFELAEPLKEGDRLTSGSTETEARILSEEISGGTITLPTDGYIWMLVDAEGSVIPTGVSGNVVISVSKPSTNIVRYTTSSPTAFSTVNTGDYVIIWSNELDPSNRLEGRVHAVTGSTLDLLVTASEFASAVVNPGSLYSNGFTVLRSSLAPQKFKVAAGTKTLNQIASELQDQTKGLSFSVKEDVFLVVKSNAKDSYGRVLVVTSDTSGALLGFRSGQEDVSKDSLLAFYDSESEDSELPVFVHSEISSDADADPINSYISTIDSVEDLSSRDPNELIKVLHPYGSIKDAQPYGEFVQQKSISGTSIDITENNRLRRLRDGDRFFVANPLDFSNDDSFVVVVDNDLNSKTFDIPLYRLAKTNPTYAIDTFSFNAYDVASGPTASFDSSNSFSGFDFSNFKVMMRARKVLKHQNNETAILHRSNKFGRSGEFIDVGYIYPSAPDQEIGHFVNVTDRVQINISLKSGPVILSSTDDTTEWNVSVTPNTPSAGIDQVTYTWSGVGTSPSLSLSGGEFVRISESTGFDSRNKGVFRISTEGGFLPTANSFTVQRRTGDGVSENSVVTLENDGIVFYEYSNTTAAEIVDYINATMSDYLSSNLTDDSGTSGSGLIDKSTYEDSGFSYSHVSLLDGINWIASSNVASSPQFTLKKALDLPTDVGYDFNDGEEVYLVPTTMEQVARFINILAVTGFTTAGNVSLVNRDKRLSLSTITIGSNGSIQIIGGSGNSIQAPISDTGVRINNDLLGVSLDRTSSNKFASDQWVRIQASEDQKKDTSFSSTTNVTVDSDTPSVGRSTIRVLNKQSNQRYFGKPRHHIKPFGRTFRIEKQGVLICLSWNGIGTSPDFLKSSLNFNDAGGGTVNISKVSGSNDVQYQILTGNANFSELSIGDLITISGMIYPENNGTFLVTGVSADGKSFRILNSSAINSLSKGSFTLDTNSIAGDIFSIGSNNLIAGTDFLIGANREETADNLAAMVGTLFGVFGKSNGNIVEIEATTVGANIPISFSGASSVTVSSPQLVGDSFSSGDFSASTEVSEGDNMILSSPFSVLNQGKFRIIRRFKDSVWFENANAIEEEVTLSADPSNEISLGYDATTELDIGVNSGTMTLSWNGIGLEPDFGSCRVGDVLTLGTDFDPLNQGEFSILRNGSKAQEITRITIPNSNQFTSGGAGKYFLLNSAGDINEYAFWFNLNSSNVAPVVPGKTLVEIQIPLGNTNFDNAIIVQSVIALTTGLTATVLDDKVTVTTVGYDVTTTAQNIDVPTPFLIEIIQKGTPTFIDVINVNATPESGILITDTLSVHRPQIKFYEYDATVPGDKLVVSGDVLGTFNSGEYIVEEVLDDSTIVVSGSMGSVFSASLNNREDAFYILEEFPYSGYKKILYVVNDPNANNRNFVVFDTNKQYQKFDESAGVSIVSLNKLNFNTIIKQGLDSYKYNVGLIAEANRVIYGDPRDPTTYPGVGAAGAEIYVREPLAKRVQISIDIRLKTGVPFSQASEQVKTSVSSLINSNPIGESIAISSIIAAVDSIPGVRAVAISSPLYDSANDTIYVAPSEKAIVIDSTIDISVSLNGL